MEKIKAKSIFQAMKEKKFNFKGLYFPLLLYLTIVFVMIYLGVTNYDFISVLILFFILLPFTVVLIELVSLKETGAKLNDSPNFVFKIFKNSFRTRRFYHLFNLKALLKLFLFILILLVITFIGVTIFMYNFDPTAVVMLDGFQDLVNNNATNEALLNYINANETTLMPYIDFLTAALEYFLIVSFVYVMYDGAFKVYVDLFIERRPYVPFRVVETKFFNDRVARSQKRKLLFIGFLLPLGAFTLLYVCSFLLFSHFFPTALAVTLLRVNLISIIPLVLLLPFMIRYVFYVYNAVASLKSVDILRFTIAELKELVKTPNFPSENIKYLNVIVGLKEQELNRLLGVESEDDTETAREIDVPTDEN